MKEQIVHGRIFQTIDDVREAVRTFAHRYNAEWLIGKNGYLSPFEKRTAWLDPTLKRAAQCNNMSRELCGVEGSRAG